ncbi:MAG: hypothetical protein IH984_14985 [Planctomycetes bacterium]|nr:hypothetical protein [Planctomycetota bacterium]
MLGLLTILAFCLGIGIVIYTIWNHDKIARFIPVRRMGVIERDFRSLKQVIVVADCVERPSGTLQEAVEDNFREGVKYLFLVSKKRAEKELNGYILIFEALAQKVIAESNQQLDVEELVQIRNLTYDWPDVPYIFYQFTSESGELLTAAFRGNQRGEGIAHAYEQLTTTTSMAIASALLAQAPEFIHVDLKVVPFSAEKDLHKPASTN